VGGELRGGGVFVKALPILGSPDPLVDPAGLSRGQVEAEGRHPGMMTR
jgi:hypothetical protein